MSEWKKEKRRLQKLKKDREQASRLSQKVDLYASVNDENQNANMQTDNFAAANAAKKAEKEAERQARKKAAREERKRSEGSAPAVDDAVSKAPVTPDSEVSVEPPRTSVMPASDVPAAVEETPSVEASAPAPVEDTTAAVEDTTAAVEAVADEACNDDVEPAPAIDTANASEELVAATASKKKKKKKKDTPPEDHPLYSAAWDHFQTNEFDKSFDALDQYVAELESKPKAHVGLGNASFLRGQIYARKKQSQLAETAYKAAVKLFQGCAKAEDVEYDVVMDELQKNITNKKMSAAEAAGSLPENFKQVMNAMRGEALATMGIARVCVGKESYPDAMCHFTVAVVLFQRIGDLPNVSECHKEMGIIQLHMGDYEDSIMSFGAAEMHFTLLGNWRMGIAMLRMKGKIEVRQKRFDKAKKFFEQALETAEKNEINEEVARLKLSLGDLRILTGGELSKQRRELYESALEVFKECEGLETEQAECLLKLGNFKIDLFMNDTSAWLNAAKTDGSQEEDRGLVQSSQIDLESALTLLKSVSEDSNNSEIASVNHSLGRCFTLLADIPKAAEYYKAALSCNAWKEQFPENAGQAEMLVNRLLGTKAPEKQPRRLRRVPPPSDPSNNPYLPKVEQTAPGKIVEDETSTKKAAEKAEAERVASKAAMAKAERVAMESAKKAKAERVAMEAAKKAKAERVAMESAKKAEAECVAMESAKKAEAECVAMESAKNAEAECVAMESAKKAEAERVAMEAAKNAEAECVAMEPAKKAEAERVAMEAAKKAEAERVAMEAAKKAEAALPAPSDLRASEVPSHSMEIVDSSVVLTIRLPNIASSMETELDISTKDLRLLVPNKYDFQVTFPATVDDSNPIAKFKKKTKTLTVTLPLRK